MENLEPVKVRDLNTLVVTWVQSDVVRLRIRSDLHRAEDGCEQRRTAFRSMKYLMMNLPSRLGT